MINMQNISAGGYLSASFLDWEGHVAAVIFMSGCNFKCPWCHNSDLVFNKTTPIKVTEIIEDIKRRKLFLDGVVISGGEPTCSLGLISMIREMKKIGLPIKLDTNGSHPEVLKRLLDEKLAEFIAMDVKSPLNDQDLMRMTGVSISSDLLKESIELIKRLALNYEFRTTYTPELLSQEELLKIRKELNDDVHWVVQCFKPVNCIDDNCLNYKEVKSEDIKKILPGIKIRG